MDETNPLLPDTTAERVRQIEDARDDIVDFDPSGDAENPVEWAPGYKWAIVGLLAFMAFTVTFTCISVVPIASRITTDLGDPRKSSSVLLVTIWELGEAAGPLVMAPLSEMFGRYPVINVANVGFIGATVLAALCQKAPLFIAARFLTGLVVATNVLNPAIVGDMFVTEQRGSAMSLVQLAPITGGAVGPLISGAMAETIGWRSVVWLSVGLACVCEAFLLAGFKETYKVPILRRKAARLRHETGDKALRTAFDLMEGEKSTRKLWDAMMRPVLVFTDSFVLQLICLFGAMTFSYFYIFSTTYPDILVQGYHLTPAQTGLAFIPLTFGSIVGTLVCNALLDRIYIKLRDANNGIGMPEYRLPIIIVGAFALPITFTAYGWAAELRLPLSVVLTSSGVFGFAMNFAFMPVFTFVVDAFGLYSASAITAMIVTRCVAATFLPLAAVELIKRLGAGFGCTVLGVVGLAFAPIPVAIFFYGPAWRQHSKYTKGNGS
ncbi:major facilitator superfamily transporter [Apiospora rasikravindrae]|uniref:Major facilitator superfamily transporter n=1 Tax=Apiospora rasikravindrae TaxID=990691 RepID=A0ABR1SD74_9PEZI